mmetsp:Transcript_62176/g.108753  ORF Transcript_62176/g.108753 Transcript_62176/m.108753 type:complete len:213 (-) Transcript_62176:113-751(-)
MTEEQFPVPKKRGRRRNQTQWEAAQDVMRLSLQLLLIGGVFSTFVLMLLGQIVGEAWWRVPFRFFEDTFGLTVSDAFLAFQPPYLDRQRYMQTSNVWRIFVFQPETLIGTFQDKAIGLWNWGIRAIWEGPPLKRLKAMFLGALIWFPLGVLIPHFVSVAFSGPAHCFMRFYLRYMPERCLIIDQLIVARRVHGRPLSAQATKQADAILQRAE